MNSKYNLLDLEIGNLKTFFYFVTQLPVFKLCIYILMFLCK